MKSCFISRLNRLGAHLDNEEKIKKVKNEARLNAINKPEVIKVVREEAKKLGIHLKETITAKAGEKFKKAHDAEHEVLKRKHTKKVKKSLELRKHKYDNYMWTISSRLKPEKITDIKIHPKTKPVVITVYRGIDDKNFDVHDPFAFGKFGIYELDELRKIIPRKKNTVVKDLMNFLSRRYDRIKKITEELEIPSTLPTPIPEQDSSKSLRRKRKHMKLEHKIKIAGLEYNRTLPENVPFVNNMVIKEPEYGIFFTDEFGDQAFQRWSDINKVRMEALVSYHVAASMVQSLENARFSMKLNKLIAEHPDQEKLNHSVRYLHEAQPVLQERSEFQVRRSLIRLKPRAKEKFYIHNHKDHLGKFDEKADDGYLLGYSLVSKAFRVFNTRRQQIEETYHITFDESPEAIKFSKPSVDNINIAETERYPPDEYLHPYEPSQRYQTNSNDVSFIEPYECPEPVVLETEVSSDQNGHIDQNDQSVQNDEILNDDHSEHSNHTNDEQIIDNLPNTKDIQISEHLSSPSVEDTSAQNTIPIPPPLPIPSVVTPVPQDRWSQDKHIELVNIIDFLSEEEPKKVSKALKHPGWVDAMQDELNQFARNKVWTLVPAPYGKTIIGSKWVFRNKRDETGIVIKNKARLVAQGYNQQEGIAQGYNQQEGIDYDETIAPVARLQAIMLGIRGFYNLMLLVQVCAVVEDWRKEKKETLCSKKSRREKEQTTNKSSTKEYHVYFLKNIEGWKPKDFKSKSFVNIQELFDKAMKKGYSIREQIKRVGRESRTKSIKRAEGGMMIKNTKLKSQMEVIIDEEKVAVDAIPLATKPPSIVD
ncbi:retrovirus-related pol polyprotein from transposon TNT 1-94 [Tanacetum coccineum]